MHIIEFICVSLWRGQPVGHRGPQLVYGALSEPAGPAVALCGPPLIWMLWLVCLWGPRWVWRTISQNLVPRKAWMNSIYLSWIVGLAMARYLLVSLRGPQSVSGPSLRVRSSVSLDGSQTVCGTLCESAVPADSQFVREPGDSQLVFEALSNFVGPSVNLKGSKSVCGALCESVWPFVNVDDSVILWGLPSF